jgi:hypothetical protein
VPVLDADVELLAAEREPDAAAAVEGLRLLHLREPEKPAEEAARLRLTAGRSRELDVVEADDQWDHRGQVVPIWGDCRPALPTCPRST